MSHWQEYLGGPFPQPTAADRAALEKTAGAALPDAYWRIVCRHQGQVLEDGYLDVPEQGEVGFGVLLLPLPATDERSSYCIETTLHNMKDYYPAGLLPFADDTGGNYWAFDFRSNPETPGIVFIDHEIEGQDGVTHVANSFDEFMALFHIRPTKPAAD